jgi:hypothetical protein
VEGWCSVEDLTQSGFSHSLVVMANQAHNGLSRCIRTREVGVRTRTLPVNRIADAGGLDLKAVSNR